MKNVSDGELMSALAKGNQSAFRELFQRHGSSVMGFSRRLLGSLEAAEEISQETWIRVVKSAEDYQDRGTFRAYVFTIARRLSLNWLRKQNRLVNFEPDEWESQAAPETDRLEWQFIERIELARLKSTFEALPENQRVALTLWLSEDLSYEQIANQLGLSVSAIKSLLFRARQTLEKFQGGAT